MIFIIWDMYTGFTESRHRKKATPFYSDGGEGRIFKNAGFIVPFILILVFPLQITIGQKKSDIGILGGTSYYMGDVNHSRHFYSPSLAGGIIWRYNFNPRNSIRFSGIWASLKGDPADFNEPYPNSPHQAFATNLVDLGISTEFNFLPYQSTKIRRDRYSPYVSGGLG